MSINRTNLVTGPALASYTPTGGSAVKMFSKEDVSISLQIDTFKIGDVAHGEQDERFSNVIPETSFSPEGRWSAALIAALWPYANAIPGQSVIGGVAGAPGTSDSALVFNAADGEIHTIESAFVYKMPTLTLSSIKTLIGAVGWRGVRTSGSVWTTANGLYGITATGGAAGFVDATYDPGTIKTQAYTGAWGAVTGFTTIDTEAGWTVDFNVTLEPKSTDSLGIIDYRFKSLEVMAKCTPVQPTSTQILTNLQIQGSDAGRGRSLRYAPGGLAGSTLNPALTITGADGIVYVTIPCAGLRQAGFKFGSTVLRDGEIGFYSARTFASGVQSALFTLAAS